MKLAFISTQEGLPWGGSEELWFRAAKQAKLSGHSVCTLTKKWQTIHPKIQELQSLEIETLFFERPMKSLFKKVMEKSRIKNFKDFLFPELQADYYILSNGSTFNFLDDCEKITELIINSKSPYIIISQHNFENGYPISNQKRGFGIDFIAKAKYFLFVSERNLKTAERQLAYKINNGVCISNPINLKNISIKKYPNSSTLLMACVARLDCYYKGQDVLLQVLGEEIWKNRDFKLSFYGVGENQLHLQRLISLYGLEEKVILKGHVSNIDEIWEQNQVLVLPSVSEGTPLALVEAMLSGRTSLSTDVGDIGKYVIDNKTGFLTATASYSCLKHKLDELWNNKGLLEEFGRNAYQNALQITDLNPAQTLLNLIGDFVDARIPTEPPLIKPVSTEEERPKWSVMIPVYNCARFIPEVLESVLLQNIPEKDMQIEVIDDASTDADVEAIVQQIGKGRIKYFRQPQNVGSLRNFETCINRSRGKLIHLLHGDDRIRPGYYKKIEELFEQHSEAGAAFCRVNFIDGNGDKTVGTDPLMEQNGLLDNWLLRIAENNHIQYAAITVRREVYEKLGSFYGSTYGEDWEMWVRLAKNYPVAYTPESLADYRVHENSISGEKFSNGESIRDIKRVMNIFKNYLPQSKRNTVLRKTKKHFAWYCWSIANSIWHRTHNRQITRRIIKQTFTISKSNFTICWELGKLYMRTILSRKKAIET